MIHEARVKLPPSTLHRIALRTEQDVASDAVILGIRSDSAESVKEWLKGMRDECDLVLKQMEESP